MKPKSFASPLPPPMKWGHLYVEWVMISDLAKNAYLHVFSLLTLHFMYFKAWVSKSEEKKGELGCFLGSLKIHWSSDNYLKNEQLKQINVGLCSSGLLLPLTAVQGDHVRMAHFAAATLLCCNSHLIFHPCFALLTALSVFKSLLLQHVLKARKGDKIAAHGVGWIM